MDSPPTSQGRVDARFRPVREVFDDVLAEQNAAGGSGAALAVWRDGHWVVDLWGGYADRRRTRAWRADSLVMPYSVTKPFAAVALLHLVDRGLVELDAPVAVYWPELTAPATVRQLLAHQSGHAVLDAAAPPDVWWDWTRLCGMLADQEPNWVPGSAHGEAALFYGHLAGEVVRRVDGRSLGRYLREQVCGPLGLDFYVGVPTQDLGRVVDLTGFGAEFREQAARTPMLARALGNPPGALDPVVVNSRAWRTAEIPAVNGHGTARAVAGLYAALEQGRLLADETHRAVVSAAGTGPDVVLGDERSWGLGVIVDSDGYCMGGIGGSFGSWSHVGRYAMAFLTGHIADHDRGDRLERSVRECLGLPGL